MYVLYCTVLYCRLSEDRRKVWKLRCDTRAEFDDWIEKFSFVLVYIFECMYVYVYVYVYMYIYAWQSAVFAPSILFLLISQFQE